MNAEPVVEALEGQVEVLFGFEFDDGEAAGAVGGQEVDEIAVLGGESGDLTVDGFKEGGIDGGEVAADGDFEAAFGGVDGGPVVPLAPGAFEGADPVAGVAKLDGILAAVSFVGEQSGFEQSGIEMFQTQSGGNVLIQGQEDSEAFDGAGFAMAAAEVVVPDQGKGEGGIGGGHGRGEEGGPAAGSFFDDGAGVGG